MNILFMSIYIGKGGTIFLFFIFLSQQIEEGTSLRWRVWEGPHYSTFFIYTYPLTWTATALLVKHWAIFC